MYLVRREVQRLVTVLDQKGVSHALILLGMVLLSLLAVMTMENQTSPPTSARPVHRRVCEHANAQKESILWAVS